MGYCPFLVLCRDREFWVFITTGSPGRDRVPSRTHDTTWVLAAGVHARKDSRACVTQ